jgi:NADH-quinone oxidoreductase subunit A
MILDFLNFIIFFGVVFLLIGISLCINYLIKEEYIYEKISSYECGFDAFSEARDPFDIKFYLVAILFIIFDIEVLFFFPWIFSLNDIFYYGYFIKILFIIILMLGFAYEYRKQCLDFI